MKPECGPDVMPRTCADAFQEGAVQMATLHANQKTQGEDIREMKTDVKEMKEILQQAKGAGRMGRAIAAAGGAIFGAVLAVLGLKN